MTIFGFSLPHIISEIGYKILIGSLVLFIAWIFIQCIQNPLRKILRKHLEPGTCMMISRTIRTTVFIFAAISALASVGIDMKAIITGLGVTGISVGLACKDMLSNLIAGLMLIVHRPFKINDQISIKEFAGKVTDINLRYTVLIQDNQTNMIPNTLFLTTPVEILNETNQ